jgi:hypothetical protein
MPDRYSPSIHSKTRAGFDRAGETDYVEWPDGETLGARYVWAAGRNKPPLQSRR